MSASLEDAAPSVQAVSPPPAAQQPQTQTATNAPAPAPATTAANSFPPPPVEADETAASGPAETTVPPLAGTRRLAAAPKNADFVEQGTRRSDNFPTFADSPQGATTQMTDEEKAVMEAEMAARLKRLGRSSSVRESYQARAQRLRKLARDHGEETLKEIENN